jgi:Eco57I restriction-modification methylase
LTRAGRFLDQAQRLAAALAEAAQRFPHDEANFRREAEEALEALVGEHGITLDKRFERILETRGRADAVFNRLIVEWEPPGGLAAHVTHPGNRHAVEQLRAYIEAIAHEDRQALDRLAGVACDGRFMIFARYRSERWIVDEPVPVDALSAEQLLETIVAAQSGRALTADNLLRDFGSRTLLTRQLASRLLDRLDELLGHEPEGFAARLYRQWETFFAVATGVVGDAEQLKADARRALAVVFGRRPSEIDPARALFALQTYFALVTKLLALLALSLYVEGFPPLDLEEMAVAGDDDLREDLEELQRGVPFRRAGLANVVEPDVFGWYLDWNDEVRDGVRWVLDKLKDYDPATLQVSPEDARDLLKDLYQGLLPRPVRHALGQYFTPDWLAEQLLHQAGYEGDPEVRLVDPACGTGTFLVLSIARLKERLRRDRVPEREALECILANVVGFDIDPLAAVAARANYVLALGTLIREAEGRSVDIPVYLADSIVMPAQGATLLSGEKLELVTSGGTFALPLCIDTGDELRAVCDLAAEGLEFNWTVNEYVSAASRVTDASSADLPVLAEFYSECLEQHRRGLDGLWPHVLRNAFMPAFIGEFDLVVGNPPWVNWESLPQRYRDLTDPIWRSTGLFVHSGMETMLGAGKKDVSMLMSYVATDKFLRDGGRLGFVITQTVFKTAGAGQGFRRFRVGDTGAPVCIEHVDDMVDLNPFVGASNRTSLFVWRKGARTRYPARYVLWQRLHAEGIRQGQTLESVLERTRRLELVAAPVSDSDTTSAWLTCPREVVDSLRKLAAGGAVPAYDAHEGVNTGGANGIYWVSVDGPPDRDGRVPVTNLHTIGKKKPPQRYGRVEKELIHPLVRGADIARWLARPSVSLLLTQDPTTRAGIDEATMESQYSGARAFLALFEDELRARAAFKRYFTRKRGGATIETGPYWSMFNVGSYTLSPSKVAWKDIATDFAAAVLEPEEPVVLCAHTAMEVACHSTDEAHYLCAVLNSTPARTFVASYVATHISTHTVSTILVPKFDARDSVHGELAAASRAAHADAAAGAIPDQGRVDKAAAELWGLSTDDVDAMAAYLERLHKRDIRLSEEDAAEGDSEDEG